MNNKAIIQILTMGAASIFLFSPSAALADSPSIRTRQVSNNSSISGCLRKVRNAVIKVGFTVQDVDSNDVEGYRGSYATEVICMDDRILVIVAGPSSSRAGILRDAIASRL